jgi:hypothetical protein
MIADTMVGAFSRPARFAPVEASAAARAARMLVDLL